MDEDRQDEVRIEVIGDLDRHGLEALQLEVRRMAKQHGIKIAKITVEKIDETGP
jgi:hypothetical protein